MPKRIKLLLLLTVFVVFFLIGLTYLVTAVLHIIEPSSTPQNVLTSNFTNSQATISWTTAKATRGKLVVSPDGNFPLLDFLLSPGFKDDGERKLQKSTFKITHHFTVKGLTEGTTYYYRIYQGWKRVYEGSFTTGPILSAINAPYPIYGRVLTEDGQPASDILVYLWTEPPSSLASTTTDKEGNWGLDLGLLRDPGLNKIFILSNQTKEKIRLEDGRVRIEAEAILGKDKPWQDLYLNKI